LNYVFGKLGDLCALVSLVNGTLGDVWWICEYVYLLIFVVNGDTCTFDILIGDVHLGENSEVWFIWMWFYDPWMTMTSCLYFEVMNYIC